MERKHEPMNKIKLRQPMIEYNPVVDSMEGKFTALSVCDYVHTRGLIIRDAKRSELIGYCKTNPKKALKQLFPRYQITRANGYELFSSGDFEESTPMRGLVIDALDPIKGISGEINDLLGERITQELLRKQPPQEEVVKRIIDNLKEEQDSLWISKNYKQYQFNKQQLIDIISEFLS